MSIKRTNTNVLKLVTKNKSAVICVLFLVIFYAKKSHKNLRRSSENKLPNEALVECSDQKGPVISVPSHKGNQDIRIAHISDERFDKDYTNFEKSHRHFSGEARAILSILVPSYRSKAMGLLLLHMGMLGLRTYMSLIVADLDGRIVHHLIGANGRAFMVGIMEWLMLAVPASYTNALIRFLEARISLEFRKTLVRYVHDLYMGANQEYYKVNNIDGALDGIDHYITGDITKFSSAAARLYSSVGKPVLDLFTFAYQLSKNLGRRTLAALFVNYFVTATLLRDLSPPFGMLAAEETQLEGEYRNAHSRVITNAEEIAFYDGAAVEKLSLQKSFDRLIDHTREMVKIKAIYSVFESYILKYSWSASGYFFASVPVFFPSLVSNARDPMPAIASGSSEIESVRKPTERDNIGQFVTNKRIMMSISDAGGRIMYSIKDLAELAGYTRRVYQLIATLHRVRKQAYHKSSSSLTTDGFTLADVQGKLELVDTPVIKFDKVPVVVPGLGYDLSGGEVLLNPITFQVDAGQHLLIVGSNGTGKSSIARLAAGLWPVYRGLLTRCKSIVFVPQRPYFSFGTLRSQIVYPLTEKELVDRGIGDRELIEILERVNLAYLPEREGGLDAVKEWKDVLSGGEKQRMQFARVLFLDPKFVVIDEGTSAVSADMEGLLYDECKAQGITLITISHRISLLKYHEMKLEIGEGEDSTGYTWEGASSQEDWHSLDKEIEHINGFLDSVPKLKRRRDEIIQQLRA